MRTGVLAATLLASAFAQPSVQNAAMENRQAPAAFRSFMKTLVEEQSAAAWIGWAVKAGPERGESCCWHSGVGYSSRGCWLEGAAAGVTPIRRAAPIQLEGDATAHILVRVENNQVTKVRGFSGDCELDAGGLRFIWLTEVQPRESVAYLAELREKREPEALHAIAMHADPMAMGLLSDTARKNPSAHIRGVALHLLAREAGERAVPVIRDSLANDPEMKVKERAVFALSQLPRDQGVPLLIDVARTNRHPEVRKKAMFWLGQSRDPRAISFFEQLLGVK